MAIESDMAQIVEDIYVFYLVLEGFWARVTSDFLHNLIISTNNQNSQSYQIW